jgi:hypothetical protein
MNNPFIKFSPEISSECDCEANLPICFGSDLAFESDLNMNNVAYVTLSGDMIKSAESVEYNDNKFAQLTDDLSKVLAPGDCFRIIFEDEGGNKYYSNSLIYIGIDTEYTLLFDYWLNDGNHLKTRLYALLSNPQPKTNKTEYETTKGTVKTLSKKRRKEYELEFYFYPESIHDSIEEMLCFPNITVEEVPMYESGDYEIDWEGKDENGYARSTTKLSEQNITKYSNC